MQAGCTRTIYRDISTLVFLLLAGCNPARGVPIFLWHSVGTNCVGDAHDVPPEEFERELSDLETWGATPITLTQLFDARDGKAKLPARPVVLTFDDGRPCQFTEVLPALRRHHMVAETFVITERLAEDAAHRQVDHEKSGDHGYLTWPELRQMEQSGAFVAESHGMSHTRLTELSEDAQRHELVESRRTLEAQLGHPMQFFSYPFGAFSRTSRNLAEASGYRAALGVQNGIGTRYALKRISLLANNERFLVDALRDAFGSPP